MMPSVTVVLAIKIEVRELTRERDCERLGERERERNVEKINVRRHVVTMIQTQMTWHVEFNLLFSSHRVSCRSYKSGHTLTDGATDHLKG